MGEKIRIREAVEEDKDGILGLIRSAWPGEEKFSGRYYDHYFSDDPVTAEDLVLVGHIGSRIVGVIGYGEDYFSYDYSYHLSWFVVERNTGEADWPRGCFRPSRWTSGAIGSGGCL